MVIRLKHNDLVEARVIRPGRPTGFYETADDGNLRLKEVLLPEVPHPFDVAVLPNTLTGDGDNLHVILVGEISHPSQTLVPTRILGGVQWDGAEPHLIGVAAADPQYGELNQIDDLSHLLREELICLIDHSAVHSSGEQKSLQWLDLEAAHSTIRQAIVRLRQVQLESEREAASAPSWRPADRDGYIVGYMEVDHYTDAEFTFFRLPYRFQQYMEQHLADDERILFALSRPEMRSRLQSTWYSRKKLHEGVLILTDQRLILLVELVPPGSSGVRYGFEAGIGVIERLQNASIDRLYNDTVVMRTGWVAKDGVESLAWEFPPSCGPELEKLFELLSGFIAENKPSRALRRAFLPPVPENPQELKDPGANDPKDVEPVLERFTSALPGWLDADEKFLSWAFLPAWFEKEGFARVLLATDRGLRVMPDPIQDHRPEVEIFYHQVSSLEYMSSILRSQFALSLLKSGHIHKWHLNFPYPSERAFYACFEAARRCVAITPLDGLF